MQYTIRTHITFIWNLLQCYAVPAVESQPLLKLVVHISPVQVLSVKEFIPDSELHGQMMIPVNIRSSLGIIRAIHELSSLGFEHRAVVEEVPQRFEFCLTVPTTRRHIIHRSWSLKITQPAPVPLGFLDPSVKILTPSILGVVPFIVSGMELNYICSY